MGASPIACIWVACEFSWSATPSASRAVVTAMFEDYGATVTAVATADEALESSSASARSPRERLAMPDKGGYWLIGRVRDHPHRARGRDAAAALTGFAGPEHRASIVRVVPVPHREAGHFDKLLRIVARLGLKAPSPPQD